jgi:DNA-binding LacI/PurR family transcriptional regulator
LALGALRALHEYGARVPQDVAVIGFDEVEGGRFSVPTLSTVAPDKEALARTAVALRVGRIEKSARPGGRGSGAADASVTAPTPQDHVVAHRLVLRESTQGAADFPGRW